MSGLNENGLKFKLITELRNLDDQRLISFAIDLSETVHFALDHPLREFINDHVPYHRHFTEGLVTLSPALAYVLAERLSVTTPHK